MKKLLALLMAAMLLPMAMNAQLLPGNNDIKAQRAPYMLKSFNQRLMTPMRADLSDGQMIMGHYDTDDVQTGGYLGLRSFPGVIPIAVELTPDELAMFQGGKIVAFRVGLASSTPVTRVFVAPTTETSIGAFTEWSCNVNAEGWNVIPVDPPYEINLDSNNGLFIGFDYKQTSSNYPISCVMVGDAYPTYAYLTYQGTTGWFNTGMDGYGNLSVQCIVESDNFPEYCFMANGLFAEKYVKMGENIPFRFNIKNGGIAVDDVPVGACGYDVLIDGEMVNTFTNLEAFGSDYVQLNNVVPSTGLALGKHTLTVVVNTFNGEPVETPITLNAEFTIYEFGYARQMHVVEQFTSVYCTHCPKGNSMLNILTNMRDDIAWVGIHGNMQSGNDPMNTAQCDTIMGYQGCEYFPSASFDRTTGLESDEDIVIGIGFNEPYHQEVAEELSNFFDYIGEAPSFATVNINSTIDENRNAVITISGELTPDFDEMLGADSKLTVYLTEDGVVARQLNDGTWVSNYVHNGVLRRALNSVFGSDLNRNGNKYENVFTYTIPSSWNIDNMNVVAFISRPLANGAAAYTDMFINQANKRKLGEFDEPSLRGDVDGNGAVNISDVTALINYLLSHDATGIDLEAADCDLDDNVNISDVTRLINYLLSHNW